MLQLAKLLVLILLVGSVQGSEWIHWQEQDSLLVVGRPSDSLVELTDLIVVGDPRITDTEYWYWERDTIGIWPNLNNLAYGTLYRRLDRWYLDTVQVCDTAMTETAHADHSGRYSYETHYSVVVLCRDTTIYKQRVKAHLNEDRIEWIRPGEVGYYEFILPDDAKWVIPGELK